MFRAPISHRQVSDNRRPPDYSHLYNNNNSAVYNDSGADGSVEDHQHGNQSGHSSETTATLTAATNSPSPSGDIDDGVRGALPPPWYPAEPQGQLSTGLMRGHAEAVAGNLRRQQQQRISRRDGEFRLQQIDAVAQRARGMAGLVGGVTPSRQFQAPANNGGNLRLPHATANAAATTPTVATARMAGILQVAPFARPPLPATRQYEDERNEAAPHERADGDGEKEGGVLQIKDTFRRIRRPRQWIAPRRAPVVVGESNNNKNDNGKQDDNNNYNEDGNMVGILLTARGRSRQRRRNVSEKGRAFIIEFLLGSSIHGFIYLAKMGLNFVERILWFVFICIALFSIIALSKRTWERFQTSPTVISMDRNKLVWNTSFPSLTVCPHKRIDELKVEEYMLLHTETFESEEDKEDFRDFIVKLASLSYENIETLPINKTFNIASDKYLDVLYELKWNFEPEISSGAAVQMYIYETLTEFGICHSVNSLVARYNSIGYWKQNEWNLLDHGERVTVHPLDGEIYAQIINLSTAYDVYFHGAGDVPNISKQRYTFPESDYTTVELIALEIYTADAAKAFTTKQRKCRFQHEAEDLLTVPIYSFGLCLAECRMFFSLRVCGCVPHFYRNRLRNGRTLPICGFEGISCIARIKREIITLKSDRYKINCNCLSNCDDSNFFVQSYRSRVWFLGANLQWGIIDYPKMQLRRDVLFSFADVLVYIGGLVGFFLGCSALSFTEIIYYFTARLVRRMFVN